MAATPNMAMLEGSGTALVSTRSALNDECCGLVQLMEKLPVPPGSKKENDSSFCVTGPYELLTVPKNNVLVANGS